MTHTMPVTQARQNLLNLVDKVDEEYTRIDLTKKGVIKAVLVSYDYLDSLEETIYTLTHSMDDIKKSREEFARGEYITLDDVIKRYNRRNARKISYK